MAKAKSVKKTAKPRPVAVDVTPDGMKWNGGLQLVKGDVLRMIVENENHPKYGQVRILCMYRRRVRMQSYKFRKCNLRSH